jgi:hypothetical protein
VATAVGGDAANNDASQVLAQGDRRPGGNQQLVAKGPPLGTRRGLHGLLVKQQSRADLLYGSISDVIDVAVPQAIRSGCRVGAVELTIVVPCATR